METISETKLNGGVTNAGITLLRALIGDKQWDDATEFAHLFQRAFPDQSEVVYGYYRDHQTSEHVDKIEEFIGTIELTKGSRDLVCLALRSYPYQQGYWCLALYFDNQGTLEVSHVRDMTYQERTRPLRLMKESLPELSRRLGVPLCQKVRAGRPVSSLLNMT